MSIEKYIKDWEKLCDNDSELSSVRRQVATILKDYLTSMLDGIEKELPPRKLLDNTNISLSQDMIVVGRNAYREEVINIINSHR